MKNSATGGTSPWDTSQYLNMWTVSALNSNGRTGILGYTQFPSGDRATDGVVMAYNYLAIQEQFQHHLMVVEPQRIK